MRSLCVDGGVPNTKQWVCDSTTGLWENRFNHDHTTRTLERIHTDTQGETDSDGNSLGGNNIQTACGNVNQVIELSISVEVNFTVKLHKRERSK